MDRVIKFRGLRTDKGGWAYGHYMVSNLSDERVFIIADILKSELFRVIPHTVGQFTGLTDRNGKEIYEGDWLHNTGYACHVIFIDGGFHTVYSHPEDGETLPIIDVNAQLMTVIGNIHESEVTNG